MSGLVKRGYQAIIPTGTNPMLLNGERLSNNQEHEIKPDQVITIKGSEAWFVLRHDLPILDLIDKYVHEYWPLKF